MIIERKQKLVEYLYPTEELMGFMCDDVYQELLQIIPRGVCIGTKNITQKVREENLKFVKEKIINFVQANPEYKKLLFEHYKSDNLAKILNDILIGLVFYIANTSERYNRLDIFTDKKSICYRKISVLDFMQ